MFEASMRDFQDRVFSALWHFYYDLDKNVKDSDIWMDDDRAYWIMALCQRDAPHEVVEVPVSWWDHFKQDVIPNFISQFMTIKTRSIYIGCRGDDKPISLETIAKWKAV